MKAITRLFLSVPLTVLQTRAGSTPTFWATFRWLNPLKAILALNSRSFAALSSISLSDFVMQYI